MAVDLHLHTFHSDGSLSPEQLIDLLEKFKVNTFAITDHDTISAIPQAKNYAEVKEMQLIPGVELSIEYALPGKAHLHLLGLFIDVENPQLTEALQELRKEREKRAFRIIEKLNELGIEFTKQEIHELTKHERIGRPHIGKLLVNKGVVKSISEAFEKFIGRTAPAYAPKKKLQLKEAVQLIHQAKGLAIVAHPYSLGFNSKEELFARLDALRDYDIDGLEAYYSMHDEQLTQWLLEYAKKFNLAVSGGSDFHGEAKKEIQPVIGTGELKIPEKIVDELVVFHSNKYDLKPQNRN